MTLCSALHGSFGKRLDRRQIASAGARSVMAKVGDVAPTFEDVC